METVLYIDTSNKYLTVGISIGDKIAYKKQYYAFKKQSEYTALEIQTALSSCKLKSADLTSIVVANGPGSYTGVRIGLTLAKVMAKALKINLYTVSSLRVLAGINKNTLSIIDAKGGRAYVGIYNEGKIIKEDLIMDIESIKKISDNYLLSGDLNLLNIEEKEIDFVENMFQLKKFLIKTDVDLANAIYLKD